MKNLKLAMAFLFGFLLIYSISYGSGDKFIDDRSPINMIGTSVMFDERHYGLTGGSPWGGIAGSYVQVGVVITTHPEWYLPPPPPTNPLTDYDQIIRVVAVHSETEYEFTLHTDTCKKWGIADRDLSNNIYYYRPDGGRGYSIFLMPYDWIFTGKWKFILFYYGRGGVHRQSVEISPISNECLATKPSNVVVQKGSSSIYVSWSGMGNPFGNKRYDYRVLISDDSGCPIAHLRCAGWNPYTGNYDEKTNRVEFDIPLAFSGKRVRFENRLTDWDGDPGHFPTFNNRAVVHSRLP